MAGPFDDNSIDDAVDQSGILDQKNPATPPNMGPAKPKPQMSNGLFAAMLGAGAADGLSTAAGLSKGMHETNPLLSQNKVLNPLETVGTNLGLAMLARHLYPNHPTLAKIIGAGTIGTGYADTLVNATNLMNNKKK